MERKTIKFKTPVDKHEVEIYEYLTGGESEQIQEVMSDNLEMDFSGTVGGKIGGKSVLKARDKTLEIMLVSVNGEKKELVKKVKDFRESDYRFVVEKVNEINKPEVTGEKKKKERK